MHGERFLHIAVPLLFGILGFLMATMSMNVSVRYISMWVPLLILDSTFSIISSRFFMAQSYAGFIVFWAWVSNSIPRSPSKRAVALAIINSFSTLGNVIGS